MVISVVNVPAGWRIQFDDCKGGSTYFVGPRFNSTSEAWAWQSQNIIEVEAHEKGE